MESQKIYVGDGTPGAGTDAATIAAMMNGGGMNGMWNSPFAYLMLLPFLYGMNGGGFGFGGNRGMGVGQGLADVGLSNQIQNLSNQVSDNQNTNATTAAINAVGGSVKDNGIALNAGVDTLAASLCGLKGVVQEQGFANQLANCQQTNTILQSAQGTNNVIQNGFTQIGFQLERNACDVKETSTANTQRIIDTLNNKWTSDAASTITQLRDEIATLNQTNALIAALGGGQAAAKSVTA